MKIATKWQFFESIKSFILIIPNWVLFMLCFCKFKLIICFNENLFFEKFVVLNIWNLHDVLNGNFKKEIVFNVEKVNYKVKIKFVDNVKNDFDFIYQ